jgi:hypothetical protein
MMEQPKEAKPGWLPRLIAGAWFGVAACIPVVFFFLAFGKGGDVETKQDVLTVWLFILVPVSIACVLGSTIGVRILDMSPAPPAALIGVAVAVLSYLGLALVHISSMSLLRGDNLNNNQTIGDRLNMAITIYVVGAILVGWLIVISGGVAGTLLRIVSRTRILAGLINNSPRVSSTTALGLTIATVFLWLLANGAFLMTEPLQRLLLGLLNFLDSFR